MSYHYNSHIVQDGLALCLDAGDKVSHAGSTTWKDLSGNGNNGTLSSSSIGYSDSGYNLAYAVNNTTEDAISLNVQNNTALTSGQVVQIESEQMLVGNWRNYFGSSSSWYVTRGHNSTTAAAHSTGTDILEAGTKISFGGDETTDLVTVSHNNNLNFGIHDFSITFFFNASSTASQTGLLQKAADWSTAGWRIRFANGGLEYQLRPGHHYANGTTNLSTNTWYHGAITGDRSDTWAKIYINGAEETLEQGDGELYNVGNMDNTADLWIGRYYSAGYTMNGSVANVCIYDRELSSTEVSQNFNAHRGRFGI